MTYTLKSVAKKLKIPESTARFYRDRHEEFIPYIGRGRRRRYTDESLEILLRICASADKGMNAIEIDERLDAEYDRIIEVKPNETEPQAQRSRTAAQQETGLLPAVVKVEDFLPIIQGMIPQELTTALTQIAETLTLMRADNERLDRIEALLKRRTRTKPTKAQTIKDMKQLTRNAMTELEKIRVNLDRMAVWVENRE